jgi:hypothetical protein
MQQASIEHLADALGIEGQPGDPTYDTFATENPTIKAFVEGRINFQEAIFIESYLANGFHAGEAARSAKYLSVRAGGFSTIADGVLRKQAVKAVLVERLSEKAMDANEVLARYRDLADATLGDFLDISLQQDLLGNERWVAVPNLAKAAEAGRLHLLKEFRVGKDGELLIKLRDQDHALDQIAKNLGVFEKDNAVRLPPELLYLLNLTPEQRAGREHSYSDMEDWNADDAGPSEETGGTDPET